MTPRTGTWHCPPKNVLVGVDFGDASALAVAIAKVVAAGFNARLRVLHAERFEPPPIVMATPSHSSLLWGFTDAVTKALMACDRPVLFVPSLKDGERG